MPSSRLARAIQALVPDGAAMVQRGVVQSVLGDGSLTVDVDLTAKVVTAIPMTDEPFAAGRRVWLVEAAGGPAIVLGSVRG